MRNSELEKLARATIATIMLELDPDRIKSRFDNLVDKASTEFDYEPTCPITHKEFHRIIANFIAHLYNKAGSTRIPTDPLAEAIWLLEAGYQSTAYGMGYIAALLDANDPAEGGIQTVLTGLTESIKAIKRQEHTTAVFARYTIQMIRTHGNMAHQRTDSMISWMIRICGIYGRIKKVTPRVYHTMYMSL